MSQDLCVSFPTCCALPNGMASCLHGQASQALSGVPREHIKAISKRPRKNKTLTTCIQTQAQAFKVIGNISHLFYFKHSCKDNRVNVLLAVLDPYQRQMATKLGGWVACWRTTFSPGEQHSTGAGCPGKLGKLHPWKDCGWPYLLMGLLSVGVGLWKSLSTNLCDSLSCSSAVNTPFAFSSPFLILSGILASWLAEGASLLAVSILLWNLESLQHGLSHHLTIQWAFILSWFLDDSAHHTKTTTCLISGISSLPCTTLISATFQKAWPILFL